jgi:uncharacterized membrane protein
MTSSEFFSLSVTVLETVGVGVIVVGFALTVAYVAVYLVRSRSITQAYIAFRRIFGGVILLGIEILVASDLIRSVALEQTLESVLVLGLLVVIRTILSFSIEIDITGNLPWREALTNTGVGTIKQALSSHPLPESSGSSKRGPKRAKRG